LRGVTVIQDGVSMQEHAVLRNPAARSSSCDMRYGSLASFKVPAFGAAVIAAIRAVTFATLVLGAAVTVEVHVGFCGKREEQKDSAAGKADRGRRSA
jgi:hypothetical protein